MNLINVQIIKTNKMSKEEIFKKHFEKVSGKIADEMVLHHMNYVLNAMQEYADQQTKELQEKVECRDKVILEYINLRYEDTIIIKHLQSKIDELENEIESMHQNNAGADI